jgi:glucosyl-3-phosphoglycerate synthase
MADFHQQGGITTLHRLGGGKPLELEAALGSAARIRPLALILPCHARDLDSEALRGIVAELVPAHFLSQVVVGLDGADEAAFARACGIFGSLPQEVSLLWNDGPDVCGLLNRMESLGHDPGPMGKGRNLRLCIGAVLAGTDAGALAIHDCDIVGYQRDLLVRLSYPVVAAEWNFQVCKGYSARFSDRLNGRVMRLLVAPLLAAMAEVDMFSARARNLQSLRYPISGEVCLRRQTAGALRLPSDWGVEAGMMADLFRVCRAGQIAQADLAENYDHKHQSLSAGNPSAGLNRMAREVSECLLRACRAEKQNFDGRSMATLGRRFLRAALELLPSYAADARINGLAYDRAAERETVALFHASLGRATDEVRRRPEKNVGASSWNEVFASCPALRWDLSGVLKRSALRSRPRGNPSPPEMSPLDSERSS